jgi:hypothetical protein
MEASHASQADVVACYRGTVRRYDDGTADLLMTLDGGHTWSAAR